MGEETDVVHLKWDSENKYVGTVSGMRWLITPEVLSGILTSLRDGYQCFLSLS